MKSLYRKHVGFIEEKEWRLVYTRDRVTKQLPEAFFSYFIGPRGIEPKLKLDLSKYLAIVGSEIPFENLVAGILLGPTASSPLAVKSAQLMMRDVGMPDIPVERSGIPYRG